MTTGRGGARRQDGQILVLFTLAVVAAIAMVGLVLDGSDTFAQRRHEQNAADMAALAGANAYLNTYAVATGPDTAKVALATAAANAAALATAAQNGYVHGLGGITVSVNTRLLSTGAETSVGITKPHQNTFARVIGFDTWAVSVDAAAQAGSIDTAIAAGPWIMHIDAFNSADGTPKYGPTNPATFGEVNGDYPVSELDIAWTDYNGSNNVDTDEVADIIDGENTVTATFSLTNGGQYIGQSNQGNHSALYGEVEAELAGEEVPVPIVGDCPGGVPSTGGCFKGWATFHVISTNQGAKTLTGYFVPDGFQRYPMTVGECTPTQQAANQCGIIEVNVFGAYTVRLVD